MSVKYLHLLENPCSCGEKRIHNHCIFCDDKQFNYADFQRHQKETGHSTIIGAKGSEEDPNRNPIISLK